MRIEILRRALQNIADTLIVKDVVAIADDGIWVVTRSRILFHYDFVEREFNHHLDDVDKARALEYLNIKEGL